MQMRDKILLLHITGATIIYSTYEHVFESDVFGFAILTMGTAIVHWLYFDYINFVNFN